MENTNKIEFISFEEAYALYSDILSGRKRGAAPFIKHNGVSGLWEVYYKWV